MSNEYLINAELRATLLIIIGLLQEHTTKQYWKHSDKYTDRLYLENGKILNLPFLSEIQSDLENLEPVITEEEYDTRTEEILYVAKEMKLL